ncbi:MAG: choice-of-anchor D domain-containing protein [Acidobacteriaceae bacterium]
MLLLTGLMVLSGCGGSNTSNQPQASGQLAGNWQFTLATPPDGSFEGNCPSSSGTLAPLCFGGFLLVQNNGSVTGAITYAIVLPGANPTICNSGSAPVTGTVNGQTVTLTAAAGNQTFTLTGVLNASTMMGTYTSTAGKGCGTAQTGLQWSAIYVPPLSGAIGGNLHSTQSGSLRNQVFPVTGTLTQGENIGASNATVTGTLNFQGYPCLSSASVNGQVSGNSVVLQIIANNGLNIGQIGAPAGFVNPGPVTVLSSAAGTALQGSNGYSVTTSSCPGGVTDIGDVCLGLGNTTACTQPILFSTASLVFPPQQVGSAPTTQTITVTNNNVSGTPLTGLSLAFNPQSGPSDLTLLSDFDGLPDFMEQDDCASPAGSPFNLAPQQSCIVTISFSPQQSCPWMPSTQFNGGEPPSRCPSPLTASLAVTSPASADDDTSFAIPITGAGFSAIVPSTPELDFGSEAVGERSAPQLLSFTNQGANSVQLLPALNIPCVNPAAGNLTLPRPLAPGVVAGLQVVASINVNGSTFTYLCDSDITSKLPNFQISADDCSGTLLVPQASCSLMITFVPQPSTSLVSGLDYFLELNTLQCTSTTTSNCEIDSGRYPVELKANLPSPLRMTPSAGLNFGIEAVGQTSTPQTVTIFNDPKDPKSATINFTGNLLQGSNFTETDNCSGSLAPGNSCVVTVTFLPAKVGFTAGTFTIGYTLGQAQTQTIFLRGTSQ